MRFLPFCLPLAFAAGCSPGSSPNAGSSNTASVDINAAAMQAQDTVDAYGANAGSGHDATIAVPEPDAANDAAIENDTAGNGPIPLNPPAPGTPGGLPDDRTPVSEAPFTPDSAQGGANVVQTYYALIGEGKYAQALALRDGGTTGPQSAADFARDFQRYSEYHANVGAPGRVDAGAGQRYVTVPVQIYARLKAKAAPEYLIGSITLHRTGDVEGATEAQRLWHIQSIDVKPAPKH